LRQTMDILLIADVGADGYCLPAIGLDLFRQLS
jgi:hypothetical protein